MLHLADGLVNVAFRLLWDAASLRMRHGSAVREEWGLMRPRGNKLIIRLRPLLSVWTARRSPKRVQSIQRGVKGALPGFRLSSFSRRRQWTEHATRWAWPRSPSPSAHQSTPPGRSGLLTRWRSCTFLWNRPPGGQEGERKRLSLWWVKKIVLSVLWWRCDRVKSADLSFDASQEKLVSKLCSTGTI